MKNFNLSQVITILSNLGVIAGIFFLAVEMEQNNRLLDAQVSYNLLQNRTRTSDEIYYNLNRSGFLGGSIL